MVSVYILINLLIYKNNDIYKCIFKRNNTMSRKRTRIKDIAEYLNINASTVSRALNPDTQHLISKRLVSQILEAAEHLNYNINFEALGIPKKRSFSIGMIVPDILNPLFPLIIQGTQSYLKSKDYALFVAYSNNDEEEALFEMKKLINRQVDGIIVASAFINDKSISHALENNIPVVAVNRSFYNERLLHHVLVKDDLGVHYAIDHLISLGHEKLVYFSGPHNIVQGKVRSLIFEEYCQKKNIQSKVFELQNYDLESGIQGAKEFIKSKYDATAIVAGNDLIAVGAIKVLRDEGIRVPEDISIVGFNGMYMSEYSDPPLTTIEIPHEKLGMLSAELLLEQIENPAMEKSHIVLQPKLIVRKSTMERKR